MTRLALLSDLHFGTVPEALAESLALDLEAAGADIVVIAGDLTQRARTSEYEQARAWVNRLAPPTLIVPGNHDVPTFNLIERFLDPHGRFERHFAGAPELTHGDVRILGLNTTSAWQPHFRWEEGRVKRSDLTRLEARLAGAPSGDWQIVTAHHPFAEVPSVPDAEPVRRAGRALSLFARHDVSLMLSGHTHRGFLHPVPVDGDVILSVGAPTALSSRMRGEPNGYWLIDFDDTVAHLTLRSAPDGAYSAAHEIAEFRWERGASAVERQ